MQPSCPRSRQRGLGLVELSMVTLIMGVIVAGIWFAASSVWSGGKSVRTHLHVIQIIQNIRSLYGARADLPPFTVAELINARVFPADMVRGTTAVEPSNNSAVTIARTGGAAPDNQRFTITYAALPSRQCVALTTNLAGNAAQMRQTGIISVTIGGNPHLPTDGGVSAAEASAQCNLNNGAPAVAIIAHMRSDSGT